MLLARNIGGTAIAASMSSCVIRREPSDASSVSELFGLYLHG